MTLEKTRRLKRICGVLAVHLELVFNDSEEDEKIETTHISDVRECRDKIQ